jgi:predicted nuclease of restriction endonuclease-like (RecB) superfamily
VSRRPVIKPTTDGTAPGYDQVLGHVVDLLESARRAAARSVNAFITATYWEIGRRIVEFDQAGEAKSMYGAKIIERLSADLTARFGRGFSKRNVEQMRLFYLHWPIAQTLSAHLSDAVTVLKPPGKSGANSVGGEGKTLTETTAIPQMAHRFPLSWSHYVLLLKVDKLPARKFYEAEAMRNGWTVRQLERQITTLFWERTLASRNKSAMLKKGANAQPSDGLSPEEEIKDPFVLEFLGLKDEYSESELEEALIRELETFLLELGSDFTFVGRQKRLRIGDEWYRIDLLFFHRKLRCLVVIDLKLGKFTHADAGQMHLYLNYAQQHWTNEGENPPVGVILCTQKDMAVVHYTLENLPNKVLAAEYRTTLPDEKTLVAELEAKRRVLESRTRKGTKP